MTGISNSQPQMDTSQQIKHVFGCDGPKMHIMPGITLLRAGDVNRCPECRAMVRDITDTLVGQSYIAFARLDLGDRK